MKQYSSILWYWSCVLWCRDLGAKKAFPCTNVNRQEEWRDQVEHWSRSFPDQYSDKYKAYSTTWVATSFFILEIKSKNRQTAIAINSQVQHIFVTFLLALCITWLTLIQVLSVWTPGFELKLQMSDIKTENACTAVVTSSAVPRQNQDVLIPVRHVLPFGRIRYPSGIWCWWTRPSDAQRALWCPMATR